MQSRLIGALVGLMLIGVGLAMFGSSFFMGVLLCLIGGATIYGLFRTTTTEASPSAWQSRERRAQATHRRAQDRRSGLTHRTAARAIARAGQRPESLTVAPVDLGLLVYHQDDDPTVYREKRPPDDADYVRPFVVLRSPRRAQGKIRFELVDCRGTRRFIDETPWELRKGETFVYPHTWLPMRNIEDFEGEWELRVHGAGVLLAVHSFFWHESGGGAMRAYLSGDGEIKDELWQDLSRHRLDRLSLDELLDDEDAVVVESDPEAEALARQAEKLNRQHRRR